jgi:toxin ParE1/3/4
MHKFIIAPTAEQDIEAVLRWSEEQFGEQARLRYEALLVQAIEDVATQPDLPGSHSRIEIAASCRTYHLYHSRKNVAVRFGRVKRPRHFLVCRTRAEGLVEIGRVLHDSTDLERHLPAEYRIHADEENDA